ncbi:hypothetical protein HPB49_017962 [Dermacentor silvarum]|uniref:Uncharacterized protein n=1 Tax=Dermacentor silvarum TaxID=543639 RepID=A0ACB8D7A1_DERSI|nr:hypothetical protein HPB49_017962 [Dermacentor silvarum]
MEVVIALRTMICALGSLSVYMALSVNSVFDLWTLCSEIVYVLLFPQLLCVFYFKETNAYGSVLAFIVSGVFRCLCGEPSMNVPVVVRLPLYDPEVGQRFPFRLLSMALGLATLLLGSFAADVLFRNGLLSDRCDVFSCFVKPSPTGQPRKPSLASDHATAATGSMGSEIMPGALTTTASEKEVTASGSSKNHRRVSVVVEPTDEAQTGGGLTRRKSSLASDRRNSMMLSGWALQSTGVADKSFTEGATTETKSSRRKSKSGGSKRGAKETRN